MLAVEQTGCAGVAIRLAQAIRSNAAHKTNSPVCTIMPADFQDSYVWIRKGEGKWTEKLPHNMDETENEHGGHSLYAAIMGML